MPSSPPTFADVQSILFTIADAKNENERDQIYGRHDGKGRFSWEDEQSLLASVANPYGGGDVRLVDPLNYGAMSADEVRSRCTLIKKLTVQPGDSAPAMPRLRPGTNRRYATGDEIDTIIRWLQSLPYPWA